VTSIIGDTIDTRIIEKKYGNNIQLDIRSNVKGLPAASGRDVTINFQTDILNNKIFWTDENGMALVKRQVNSAYSCPNATCNYYPVTSQIAIYNLTGNDRMYICND